MNSLFEGTALLLLYVNDNLFVSVFHLPHSKHVYLSLLYRPMFKPGGLERIILL